MPKVSWTGNGVAERTDRYGATDAERICSGNALRVLRAGWGRG